jgi:hypothetical protein
MARFNEILVGRYNRALQKTFGIKGGPPSPQLSTEVQPNVNMLWGAETQYLEGWQNFGAGVVQAAGAAGSRSAFRIDNPKNSNVLAVIEKILLQSQPAAVDAPFVSYSIVSAGDLANTVITTNTGLDQRGPQSPQLRVTAQSLVAAVVGVSIYQANLAINANIDVILNDHQELTLLPNSSYTIYSGVLNQALSGAIWWRERTLEPSEVT